jgi:SAM-dependent methyltransferase
MSPYPTELMYASYHQVRFRFDPERAKVWRAICHYLQRWVDEAQPTLDLGAGYGEFSRFIRAREKYALDLNPELIAHWPEDVRPVIQPATSPLELPDASAGTVFASNFFEHFTTEEAIGVLSEVLRVLKPRGKLIAVQPNFRLEPRRYFDDYTHKTAYTDAGFSGLLRACGFSVVHCEPRFTPFSMQSRWPKAEWMVRLYLALPLRPLAGQFLVVAERPAKGDA